MPRRVAPLKRSGHTLQTAAAAFLDRPDLSPASRRSYAQTLHRLKDAIGDDRPLGTLNGANVEAAVQQAWGHCAAATWNRHIATVRSFIAFCHRNGWLAENLLGGLDRRREPADRTKAIPRAELERRWRREDASVRERAFWRLCYETAGRAGEVLGLNVEDVFIDTYSRLLMGWALALSPSSATVPAALRMGLVVDPERGLFGGIPAELRLDRGLEFAAEALSSVAATLGIRISPAPAYTPHLKGRIERLNRTVAQDFLSTLPFYADGPRDAAGRLYAPGVPPLTFQRFATEFGPSSTPSIADRLRALSAPDVAAAAALALTLGLGPHALASPAALTCPERVAHG